MERIKVTKVQLRALNKLNLRFPVTPDFIDEKLVVLNRLVDKDLAMRSRFYPDSYELTDDGWDLLWKTTPLPGCPCPDCRAKEA